MLSQFFLEILQITVGLVDHICEEKLKKNVAYADIRKDFFYIDQSQLKNAYESHFLTMIPECVVGSLRVRM